MCCVTSVTTTIIWNGERLQEFKPRRGLRQGDPFSPYLFVLCLERLSNMIRTKVENKEWKGIHVARGGPCLTHLLFADDLMLFAKADISNCDTIMTVMNEFFEIFGLKINAHKSKLFVSPNIDRRNTRELSTNCGIPLTFELGKYLGVPLIHGRVNKGHFNTILEKMQRKLAGWKTSVVSLAGRATLIQSVSFVLPAYTTQTMELPIKVCNEIDRLNMNFLWGDTLGKKRIHLVKWDDVCKPKKLGGLGIRKARNQNLVLLVKLSWKWICEEEALWKDVLKSKYLTSSNLTVDFWKDWWCGNKPVVEIVLNTLQSYVNETNGVKVNDFLSDQGHWDAVKLLDIPSCVSTLVINLPSPQLSSIDVPTWRGSIDGRFSTSSAYNILAGSTIKLNTDGCKQLGGNEGFDGLFKDEAGTWLYAMQAVKLLEEEIEANSPFKGLLEDAKIIMQGCECTVQHVFKEGNLCVDALAKFGAEQLEDMLVVNEPPAELRSLLVADMVRTPRERA
ncbi:uncharacterized protein LOC114298722 [Camellia sinensis]|uniref:uncharacterized protein LOC114298722 n=1 Tax=Camellia sinensis TaxID=4442 RepID=UPI00103573C4|nr:uncharacterized protein LOC114298722 [Camellia sinensis]